MESPYNCNHFRLSPEMITGCGGGGGTGAAAIGCASSSSGLSPHSHSQQLHPSVSSSTTSSMHKAGGSVDIHSEYDLTLTHHHQQHHQHHHLSHIQSNNNRESGLTHHHRSHLNTGADPGGIVHHPHHQTEEYCDSKTGVHHHLISDFDSEGIGETRSLIDIMHHQYASSQQQQQQQMSGQGGMMTSVDMDDLEHEDLPACAFANMNTQQQGSVGGGRMELAGGTVSSPPSTSAQQGGNHFGVTGKTVVCIKLH